MLLVLVNYITLHCTVISLKNKFTSSQPALCYGVIVDVNEQCVFFCHITCMLPYHIAHIKKNIHIVFLLHKQSSFIKGIVSL